MFSSGRRYLAIWLPHWPADRWRRAVRRRGGEPQAVPLVLVAAGQGGIRLTAVSAEAAALGLAAGMTLADAQALVPDLRAVDADPAADRAALEELADWCGRYAPWTATDGTDGLRLDVTGSTHLLGGEDGLMADLGRRLAAAGIVARSAIADTPGAAWAAVRFGAAGSLPPGRTEEALLALPLKALRLSEASVQALSRVGVRSIGDLARLPRAPLALRFGREVVLRLDQAMGRLAEPISPRREPACFRVRLAFAEPVGRREDIELAARRLLDTLVGELTEAGQGIRRLDLVVFRVDGDCRRIGIGTSAPSRNAAHLLRLLTEHFDRIDPGFGIEVLALEAREVAPCLPQQTGEGGAAEGAAGLAALVDRLRNRLGAGRVVTLLPADSHIPESAVVVRPADEAAWRGAAWPERGERPLALLVAPEAIEVVPAGAEEAPATITWRRLVRPIRRAEGPERIAPEWWRGAGGRTRDYWRLEDAAGRRYWVYRETAGWYLQGLFA